MIAAVDSRQPLLHRLGARCLHNPNAAVVALDVWAAAVVAPNSAADRVVELQPMKHGLLEVVDGEARRRVAAEEVDGCYVM